MPLCFSVNFTFSYRTTFSQNVIWWTNTGGTHTAGISVVGNISIPYVKKIIIRGRTSASGLELILANSIWWCYGIEVLNLY